MMTNSNDVFPSGKSLIVPLSNLKLSAENVRKQYNKASVKQLAASIAAKGLLQNLIVSKAGDKYEVQAGGRRYRALKLLADANTIKNNHPVQCQLRDKAESIEVSLTENFQREQMHPADEISAFGALEKQGQTPEQIADKFGISHMTVRRRLKLANLSPKLLDLFRKDQATLEQLQALALSDDHATQEALFIGVPEWQRRPHELTARLAGDDMPATHKLVRYVGLKAYEAAGGIVKRDLFSDDNSAYLKDRNLIADLAIQKLTKLVDDYRKDRWSFVEVALEFSDYGQRLHPEIKLSKKDAKRLAKLEADIEGLDFDADDGAYEKQEALEIEIEEIRARSEEFSDEQKATAGIIVTVNHVGKAEALFGVVKPDVWEAMQRNKRKGQESEASALPTAKSEAGLSAAVVEDLTKFRTSCLALSLADHPGFAFRVLAYSLALQVFTDAFGGNSAVRINLRRTSLELEGVDANSVAADSLTLRYAQLRKTLPQQRSHLWTYIVETASDAQLQELVAMCVALSADTVVSRNANGSSRQDFDTLALLDAAGRHAAMDLARDWTPTPEFFKRVPKAVAKAAVEDCQLAAGLVSAIDAAKKDEASSIAAKALEGRGWLPGILRPQAVPAGLEPDEHDETDDEEAELSA